MTRKWMNAFSLALALAAAMPAAAYEFLADCRGAVRWNNNDVTWRPSTVSFPEGSSWYYSIDASRVAWNSYTPGANYRINYSWDTNTSTSNTDSRNSIVMPSYWSWGADALGVTQPRRSKCYVWPGPDANWVEMDIAFNRNYLWDTSINPATPLYEPYNSTIVAIHEHGHGMGLAHENDQLATMNSYYPSGGPIGTRNDVHPHADDSRADRALYGTAATQRDVAAFAYRPVPGYPGSSQPIPAPGSTNRSATVAIQFGVENRGTTSQSSVPVYFYLSPTRNVTTSSFFIGSTTLSLSVGATTTPTAYITIPSWAPTGYQYIGWIIDPGNSIVESNEDNNGVTLTSQTYIAANNAPNACFTANPRFGSAPLNVTFDASCSSDADGGTLSYTWNFGDGNVAYGPYAENWYHVAGSYEATLTVTDANGASSTSYEIITVTCDSGTIRCVEEPM